MSLDLAAEIIAALESPKGRAALEAIAEPVAARVLAALHAPSAFIDTNALAAVLGGITARALRARLRRGSDFAAIALTVDGKKVWRRSDVEALIATGARTRSTGSK